MMFQNAFLPEDNFLFTKKSKSPSKIGSHWVIVLAGGEGTRLRPLITKWLGVQRPKQYCTFVGTRSMLDHTLERAQFLAGNARIVTVIGSGHRAYLNGRENELPGFLIEQPMNRGTACGILLPLNYILESDPLATVTILPSDHFLFPEKAFLGHAMRAFEMAEAFDNKLILLAAVPDRPECEYGWIEPRTNGRWSQNNGGLVDVEDFREKPSSIDAERFYYNQWLWNTMIISAKAATLCDLMRKFIPDTVKQFDLFRRVMRAVREERVPQEHLSLAMANLYRELPTADFSSDILQNAPHSCLVLPMEGVHWSDWGRPERIAETLALTGRQSTFPTTLAARTTTAAVV